MISLFRQLHAILGKIGIIITASAKVFIKCWVSCLSSSCHRYLLNSLLHFSECPVRKCQLDSGVICEGAEHCN